VVVILRLTKLSRGPTVAAAAVVVMAVIAAEVVGVTAAVAAVVIATATDTNVNRVGKFFLSGQHPPSCPRFPDSINPC